MKKRNILSFIIVSFFLIGFAIAVVNFFHSQVPADLTTTNALQGALNITYNISDPASLTLSTITIFYKVNSSIADTNFFFTNGTLLSGFHSRNYSFNTSDTFTFRLFHDQIYPATYNYNETIMQGATHSVFNLNDDDIYLKIRFFNVSNKKNYSFLEVYAQNQTASSLSLRIYYCNSSYVGNADPLTSSFCTNFYNMLASEPFNHSHQVSRHHVIPFSINITSGQVGGVYVTNTSYFLLRGRTSATSAWNVSYISSISRTDTIQQDTNGGAGITWANFSGTVDAHLHQYDGTDRFWYYACADGSTAPTTNCTGLRSDLIDLSGLPPDSPDVFSPINQSYRENITIEYTAASSPNAYPIIVYNITLFNYTDSRISVITANNSANLSFVWNSIGTPDGIYNFHVFGYDSNYLFSIGESDDFTIDNTDPTISFTCNPASVNIGELITCTCSGNDALSGVANIVFVEHPTTGSAGTFLTTCTIYDTAGNSLTGNFTYSVIYGGGDGGGGGGGGGSSGGGTSGGTTTPSQPTTQPETPTTSPESGGAPSKQESIDVDVGGETHALDILEVQENSARFNFYGIEGEISVGETKTFEIGEYIVTIQLERIEQGEAIFNTFTEKKFAFELSPQNIAMVAGLVAVAVLSVLIIISRIRKKKHKQKIIKHKTGFFKKLFAPKPKLYISASVKQEISRKIQTAKKLREKAKRLVKEARQKRTHALRNEAVKKLKESYRYREKSRKLLREARRVCKNC
ncbi:MAG: hypothetical protein M1416_01595, partial [Candidatus Pacearchaeota archaeon]|nr:hypothetical protein [Candidatus Pacearchaeota archaeon]